MQVLISHKVSRLYLLNEGSLASC